jgi:hypothetical protein
MAALGEHLGLARPHADKRPQTGISAWDRHQATLVRQAIPEQMAPRVFLAPRLRLRIVLNLLLVAGLRLTHAWVLLLHPLLAAGQLLTLALISPIAVRLLLI